MKRSMIVVLVGVLSLLIGCKKAAPPVSTAPPAAVAPAVDPIALAQSQVQKTPSFDNYTALGMAYTNTGRFGEALAAFQKSVSINPKSPIAYNNICYAYNSLHKWNLGIENCQKALQIEPNFVLAKNNLAFAQKSKSFHEARVADLKKSIQSGKDVDKSRIELGLEHYTDGDYEAAVDVWKKIPKDSGLFATAQNDLASAYIITKKFDLAKTHLDRALELEPKNQLFLNNRQWLQSAIKAN